MIILYKYTKLIGNIKLASNILCRYMNNKYFLLCGVKSGIYLAILLNIAIKSSNSSPFHNFNNNKKDVISTKNV